MPIVQLLGGALVLGGVFGIAATRRGWYDDGGVMRTNGWGDMSALLNHRWIGGGVRRANYLISGLLLLLVSGHLGRLLARGLDRDDADRAS